MLDAIGHPRMRHTAAAVADFVGGNHEEILTGLRASRNLRHGEYRCHRSPPLLPVEDDAVNIHAWH
jgi:hypothetical protein